MVVISFVCLLPMRPVALQQGGFVPREWLAAEGLLRSIIFWEIAPLPLVANPTFFLSRKLVSVNPGLEEGWVGSCLESKCWSHRTIWRNDTSCYLGIWLKLPIRFTDFNKLITFMLAFHWSSHFMNRADFPVLRWKRRYEKIWRYEVSSFLLQFSFYFSKMSCESDHIESGVHLEFHSTCILEEVRLIYVSRENARV